MMKYNFVYKTTNDLNGDYYYGVHSTNNLDDGYLGSGLILKRAINKYGIDNFTREIVQYFSDVKYAFRLEAAIVTPELVADPHCYNIAVGGYGGNLIAGYSDEEREAHKQKLRVAQLGRTFSEESIQKMRKPKSEAHKQHMRKPKSEAHKQHMRESKLGDKNPAKQPKTRQKMSKSHLGKQSPNKGKHWKTVDGKRVWY